jgi:hypothetical protein
LKPSLKEAKGAIEAQPLRKLRKQREPWQPTFKKGNGAEKCFLGFLSFLKAGL